MRRKNRENSVMFINWLGEASVKCMDKNLN